MKTIIILLMLIIVPLPSLSTELCVDFEYPIGSEAGIQGYRIYRDGVVVLDEIQKTLRSVCFDCSGAENKAVYTMTAYNDLDNFETDHSPAYTFPRYLGKIRAGQSKRKVGSGKWIH